MNKLVLPQELEIWYLIPAIRKELARELVGKGLKQKEAAEILGLTEAAVSQYLKGKRAGGVELDKNIKKEAAESVKRILRGGSVVGEIQLLCSKCKKSMILCRIHKKHGRVSANCRVCLKG